MNPDFSAPKSDHTGGDQPTKSTGSFTIGLGLVPIPVSVYTGADKDKTVSRHKYSKAGNPVGYKQYDTVTGELVRDGEVVMKAATSDGEKLVELTDEEMAEVTGGRDGRADIETFVPLASLVDGTYTITGVQQLRPAKLTVKRKKIPNAAAERAFNLLREYMADQGVAALIKVALRSSARYAAVLPDGRMLFLAFADQVRAAMPLPETEPKAEERKLGLSLMQDIGVSTPVLVDTAGEMLQEYVDNKAAGAKSDDDPVEAAASVETGMDDLMAALEASLAAAAPEPEPVVAMGPDPIPAPTFAVGGAYKSVRPLVKAS